MVALSVKPKKNETDEKMIRRFTKKIKKARVLEDYRRKTTYFKTRSEIRREDRNRAIRRERRQKLKEQLKAQKRR